MGPVSGDTPTALELEATTAQESPSRRTRHSFMILTADEVRAAAHPEILALSSDEAEWLDKHAFPTVQELEAIHSFDPEMLELRLRNYRDPKAGVLLGHQLIEQGEFRRASYVLSAAAKTGALYAHQLHGVATLLEWRSNGNGTLDPIFVAYMEVARMLGDHNVDVLIRRHAPKYDPARDAHWVLQQAGTLMHQRAMDGKLRGIPAAGPDPRPNEQEWRRLQAADGLDKFEVYDRRR